MTNKHSWFRLDFRLQNAFTKRLPVRMPSSFHRRLMIEMLLLVDRSASSTIDCCCCCIEYYYVSFNSLNTRLQQLWGSSTAYLVQWPVPVTLDHWSWMHSWFPVTSHEDLIDPVLAVSIGSAWKTKNLLPNPKSGWITRLAMNCCRLLPTAEMSLFNRLALSSLTVWRVFVTFKAITSGHTSGNANS